MTLLKFFKHLTSSFFRRRFSAAPWNDPAPVREELFGIERLEQHARSLAAAQTVTTHPPPVARLDRRLRDNAAALLAAYRESALELESGKSVVPAAEWLLDNYHVVEEQIREIKDDLPPGYYRQLPKLAQGPFAGYPRVFGLAWAFVAHTDSHLDPMTLRRFIAAYQQVQPLTISELWAVAITLRIVLVENLRRLADQMTAGRSARTDAEVFANRLLTSGSALSALDRDIATRSPGPLSELFAAQLAKRLRDQDPRTTPALDWLKERLEQQNTSIDEVVLHAQQRQGASHITVRNIIISMRLMSDIDWAEFFEDTSLVDACLRGGSGFAAMDFPTRNLYRNAIEQLARGSALSELAIAERALSAASQGTQAQEDARAADPGYHLLAEGRAALERDIGFEPPLSQRITRFNARLGLGGYVGAIFVLAVVLLCAGLAVMGIGVASVGIGGLALLGLLGFASTTEVATALVNRAVAWGVSAVGLPGLALKEGVPASLRTLLVVPTLLSNEAELRAHIEELEVHYLSGVGGDISFALLSDGLDADQEVVDSDGPLLAVGVEAIAALNLRHGPAPGGGHRFYLLHRKRRFNPSENRWMGWERKRGKLHELNRLLRGAQDTSFMALGGVPPQVPTEVRYVITLDADTRLPRDVAQRLIGKMAHPLNQPRFSVAEQRVVGGHAILQPRVTPALPLGRQGSLYQRLSSGPGGMDPYAAAVSDVYQDLFGEGSYTGKGIYDVDAFEAALAGRIPENRLLSHDLFEGIFARAGLASDVEVVEEFPARYDVATQRQHRWTRGDWQLLPWVLGRRHGGQRTPAVGRWKMFDNLRRSLSAPLTLGAVGLCWLLPAPAAWRGLVLLGMGMAVGPLLPPLLAAVWPRRANVRLSSHVRMLAGDLKLAALQVLFALACLPDQAWQSLDAIGKTLVRLTVTHRQMLEWTTAAQSNKRPRLGWLGFYGRMARGTSLALALAAGAVFLQPTVWPWVLPLVLLWLVAPVLVWRASQMQAVDVGAAPVADDARALRLIARRTWRFFETFVTPTQSMLPPDNFQEDPKLAIANRTSATNIGLYLLSTVAARDFGWTGAVETAERLEATLDSMQKLARFRGHFYNWYDTHDGRVLTPAYVSSVDSGNLAGHLITLANACESWIGQPRVSALRAPWADTQFLIREALHELQASQGQAGQRLLSILEEIDGLLQDGPGFFTALPTLQRLAYKAVKAARDTVPARADEDGDDLLFWTNALRRLLSEQARDGQEATQPPQRLDARWQALADTARALALAMDFTFLLDPERHLLSIGYSVTDNALDANCYDLLASEARLASLFAIAKNDVETRHWFRLGRTATPVGNASALISWSGSMFEYLMPSLVMRAPAGSLLEQTNRLIVQHQRAYGELLDIPWGISESAYNARDMEFTYQYSNFGVPGLGLKRGLSENVVVAPYATGLATMVDASSARRNFDRMADLGALGRYGFYEALDFTRARLPQGQNVAIVRNYMAHHQGMTIVAIANTLQGGRMREHFHREPMIRACELLLQERMPRNVAVSHPRAEEVKAAASEIHNDAPSVRYIEVSGGADAPITHLLSNGRYAVMLTASGAGYSRCGNLAVTRWREDATRDDWGSFIFLRDVNGEPQDAQVWSATAQPMGRAPDRCDVAFGEDHAIFTRRDGSLTTTLNVLVSSEDDGEVRRVTVTNSGRRTRDIELTSYAEIVLTLPAADNAHPAFAKMFVQTEYLPEFCALIATRRPRSASEKPVWAAHFAVVEGTALAEPQYESDRARFLGRGRSIAHAAAVMDGAPLSNTAGTVLDPVFSLRHSVRIAPGQLARVAFWTLVAPSREALLDLIDKHHDRNAFDRAKTMAWTQAQVQLRHVGIDMAEAANFQRLAAPILYTDARFRAPEDALLRGAGSQSGLWLHAVSGDLPIVLLRIDEIEDIPQVRQLLRAHEYWRMKRLAVDLVIVNERASSYVQDLQIAIEAAVRSSPSRPSSGEDAAYGVVHTLRADLMSLEARTLLQSVARVTLLARRGDLEAQLASCLQTPWQVLPTHPPEEFSISAFPAGMVPKSSVKLPPVAPSPALSAGLAFFNGLGGFDHDGREYVTILHGAHTTPAPWLNVIANPGFGFQVSTEGSGYTWADNSRENQLTPWSNDPVIDPSGEVFYVRDEVTGECWSPTAQPRRDGGVYVARHGHGYSVFTHEVRSLQLSLLQFVPLQDPIKISRLTLRNLGTQSRRLSVTVYTEWVLGTSRGACAPFILTDIDAQTGALLARNPWNAAFSDRVAFADLGGKQTAYTADRTEFLGHHGSLAQPAALSRKTPLSGATGAGRDPCAALQCVVTLAPGQSVEVLALLGQCASLQASQALIDRYRKTDVNTVLETVKNHWRQFLGTVQVRTPDKAMDILLNGWLLYQTLACRVWARSAFYQASGAYGFRDQLQDGMALTFSRPQETRAHLLRAAGRQFPEGDVQHWWLPHSGQGVRTRISDDRVWLAFAVATYITTSGDAAVLDEIVPFLDGPALQAGEHDAFFQPLQAEVSASLFEHCARGLDQCIALTGSLGLPLMGTGDWNDGMNRVAEGGQGQSVWLGWLLVRTLGLFAPWADGRDPARATQWRYHAESVRQALEHEAWDGAWYRRATFDDGAWLGAQANEECRIDAIAQSWAVLSGAADPQRATTAMASLAQHLVRPEQQLALLFTPPFDLTPRDPGYIKGYPPGLRENGGQYSHAAMWTLLAYTRLRGDAQAGKKAHDLFALLNPINHARTPEEVARYKVEPYAIAADVYSVAPHVGRGGWTWYTGAAGWMYRAGVEGILGLRREGEVLILDPCIPPDWPGFEIKIELGASRYVIHVEVVASGMDEKGANKRGGMSQAWLDGAALPCIGGVLQVPLTPGSHELKAIFST